VFAICRADKSSSVCFGQLKASKSFRLFAQSYITKTNSFTASFDFSIFTLKHLLQACRVSDDTRPVDASVRSVPASCDRCYAGSIAGRVQMFQLHGHGESVTTARLHRFEIHACLSPFQNLRVLQTSELCRAARQTVCSL
jgi:hypothetical protein